MKTFIGQPVEWGSKPWRGEVATCEREDYSVKVVWLEHDKISTGSCPVYSLRDGSGPSGVLVAMWKKLEGRE